MEGAAEVGVEAGDGFALHYDGQKHESAWIEGGHKRGTVVTAVAGAVHIKIFLAQQGCPNGAVGAVHGEVETVQGIVRRFAAGKPAGDEGEALIHESENGAVESGRAHRVQKRRDESRDFHT